MTEHSEQKTRSSSASNAGYPRCKGWRRHGGAFAFGPPQWKQCENQATVQLLVDQDGERAEMPACRECWIEARENNGIEVIGASPINPSAEECELLGEHGLAKLAGADAESR